MKVAAIYYQNDKITRVDVYDKEHYGLILKGNLLDKYNQNQSHIDRKERAELITDKYIVNVIEFLKSCEMYNPHIDKGSAVWNKLAHISEQVDECMAMIENDEGVVTN